MRSRHAAAVAAVVVVLAGSSALAGTSKGPRVALDPKAQAAAKATLVTARDLGAGWRTEQSTGTPTPLAAACSGFHPDLSRLTLKGRAATWVFRVVGGRALRVGTGAFALKSSVEAARLLALLAVPYASHCLRVGKTAGGRIEAVTRLTLHSPRVRAIGWRVRFAAPTAPKVLYADYIFLQAKGRFVEAALVSTDRAFPDSLESRVLRLLDARVSA